MLRLLIAGFAVLLTGCTVVEPGSPRAASTPDAATAADGTRPSDQVLQERWWTWAASSPEERNPVADRTGRFCGENQPTDVWFFAGTFGGEADRSCQVPAGRPLAGPAVNLLGRASDCDSFMATAKGSVTLDGQPVELTRVDPVAITFQGVGVGAGSVPTQACGLWAWVPPLAAGDHELLITGESGRFSTSARYRLTVGAPD
ncbi:MAG: hypothetical protein ABIQ18_28120 [Umezawaea sp.]